MELSADEHQLKYEKIIEKTCACVGLGTSALLAYNLDSRLEGEGVSVCPGPNIAYFSKIMSLKNITDHIDFLQKKLEDAKISMDINQKRYLVKFANNLEDGVTYYKNLFGELKDSFRETKSIILSELERGESKLQLIGLEIERFK